MSRRFCSECLTIGISALIFSFLLVSGSLWAAKISEDLKGSFELPDLIAPLIQQDLATQDLVSDGPSASVITNLTAAGRGERLSAKSTTDVWALGDFAYTGTFNSPCGGDPEAGIWIWNVENPNKVEFVGIIPSPAGSRSNDVKVARMNSGDILVHSNESCSGGPGGFEIWNVDDPENPVHQVNVGPIDELNPISDALFGGITDVGVYNLWLFIDGTRDYVAAVAGSAFDTFRIYDITDPTNPFMVSAWGAEEVFDPGVGDELADVNRVLNAAIWLTSGFGSSANRFLHDVTITADGNYAYLSNWDAGLILLDISDPSNPQLVSVAIDPTSGSLDGEVNSHAAWPNDNGTVVVETAEDFIAWEASVPPGNITFDEHPTNVIPGTAISTIAGDDFETYQTGNSGTVDGLAVTVNSGPLAGKTYAAIELNGNQPKFADTGIKLGDFVWIGRACPGDALANTISPGYIAVVRRGACPFSEKLNTAAASGAAAIIIANDVNGTPWGGVRIWDYSDSANPVLASTFNTTCSASTAHGDDCDMGGTYSVHNVVVETIEEGKGNKIKTREMAYISWYSDGVLVLDITDPYNPVEVARYAPGSSEFEAQNGGPQDVWGIYKAQGEPWIYASDRNGGLYLLKEYGGGSAKKGKQ